MRIAGPGPWKGNHKTSMYSVCQNWVGNALRSE